MRHYLKNEGGSQILEFVGVFPLVVASALLAWQIMMTAYTFIVAEAAARDAARVASVHGDYQQAAKVSAGGLYVSCSQAILSGNDVKIEVETKVPTFKLPYFGHIDIPIHASAIMPLEAKGL